MVTILSYITEESYAQKSDNTINLSEYTNSEGGYKISYPSDAIKVEEYYSVTFKDKNGEWEFKIYDHGLFTDLFSSFEEFVSNEIQNFTDLGYKVLEKKPLTVAGFPATMISTLTDETGKGEMKFIEIVMSLPDDIIYEFYVSSSVDKFDQYADLFFTMLKSFKLTNISEANANAPKTETKEPAFKSATTYQFVKSWGVTGDGKGQFSNPQDIAVDSSTDNVYIADTYNHRIQKFDSDGKYITQWEVEDSHAPDGISIDSLGNVYASEFSYHLIQKFDSNGNFITKWGGHGTGDGELVRPVDISLDSSDNVYVVEEINHRVQKFDSNGNFITTWGSKGTKDGQFDRPYGVAVDSKGNVYVGDSDNYRIQKFDSNGNFITKWGSKGTGDGQFGEGYIGPSRMSLDSSDNVYVVDSGNYRIQKFDSNGNFITKWGSEGTKDGQFVYPGGISVDSKGNVYVTDTNTDHIQVFALSE